MANLKTRRSEEKLQLPKRTAAGEVRHCEVVLRRGLIGDGAGPACCRMPAMLRGEFLDDHAVDDASQRCWSCVL